MLISFVLRSLGQSQGFSAVHVVLLLLEPGPKTSSIFIVVVLQARQTVNIWKSNQQTFLQWEISGNKSYLHKFYISIQISIRMRLHLIHCHTSWTVKAIAHLREIYLSRLETKDTHIHTLLAIFERNIFKNKDIMLRYFKWVCIT